MTKNIDSLITKHFPYSSFNPGQKEAIEFVVNSVVQGKKHIILQAPTGIGKSVIATTSHRVLKDLHDSRWRTTIITATKGLQDQYETEDSDIYSLKGKTNYPCPIGRDYYSGKGCRVARAEGLCSTPAKICTYLTRRERWSNIEDLRLTNSAFQIVAPDKLTTEDNVRANLIVVDECHEIDEALVNHSTLSLKMEELEHLSKVTKKDFLNKFSDFINLFLDFKKGEPFTISDELHKGCQKFLEVISAKHKELEELSEKSTDVAIIGAADELGSIIEMIDLFSNQSGEWLVTDFDFSQNVVVKPVYASQVSNHSLFRKSEHFLHMSATICGEASYCQTLNIKKNEYSYMEIDNPIPIENRKVVLIPKVKVSGDFDRGRLTSLIDSIVNRHKDTNGVIHTVSFALAEEILEMSKFSKNMVISNNRDEILDLLKNNSGKILLSPSVEKGYDFKNDMCRYQVLAKVPYGFLGDPWIKLNMERSDKWYARKTILRLVQASGRGVRGVDDFATTYIVDSNFERLLKYNKELFPDWYLDSISYL